MAISLLVRHPTLRGRCTALATVTVSGEDSRYYPAEWLAYLDGEQMAVAWTDNNGKQRNYGYDASGHDRGT